MDTLFDIFNTNDKTHHSLGHGEKFNKKKSKSKNSCVSDKNWFYNRNMNSFGFKEGFAVNKSYNELREEYGDILSEYRRVSGIIADAESDYINRTTTNTGNIYLNKNIQFKNNIIAYVTNKGIVKKYATLDMFNKTAGLNGCPDKNYVSVNIDWISAYDVAGATIQMPTIGSVTGPKLLVGAPMTQGESCGNEGSNVIVNKMMDTVRSQFMGCFDNSITTNGYPMGNNYYGNAEPYLNSIQNGNFALSSYSGVGDVNVTTNNLTNWTTMDAGGLVVLINKGNTASSGNLAYPITYPNGDRAVSLKNGGDLSQSFSPGLSAGNYTLTFDACGLSTANPISIFLNSNIEAVGTITPVLTWKSYGVQIPSLSSSITKITFKGTGTAGQMSAIQNIRLTNGTKTGYTNTVDFSTCETAAKTGSYTYFGLQNVDQDSTSSTFGKGYCVLSKDTSLVSNLNSANDLSPETLLQAGGTSGDSKGISATLTATGVLLVTTAKNPIPMSTNTGTSNNTPCYLILADDGTMKIYKFPKDSNGNYISTPPDLANVPTPPIGENFIWTSGTTTKQLIPNPNYTAANGKGSSLVLNGQSWMIGGTVLSPGEFIGSPSGNIYLIMGSDGVLKLNTSKYATSCKANSNSGVMEGGANSAALYKVNSDSDNLFTQLGKFFFINDDASLKTYPTANTKFSNEYIKISSYDTPSDVKYNNDIVTPIITGKTIDDCKTSCNSNSKCYGYSYATSSNTCNLKGSNISQDKGDGPTDSGTDLYVRKQTYNSNIPGVTNTFSSIFSTQKNNYSVDSANPNVPASYGINNLVPDLRTQLSDLQNQLDDLQSQMDVYSGSSGSSSAGSSSAGSSSKKSMADFIKEIQSNEKKISAIQNVKDTNLDNMVEDTDLIVLQENYKYLCWSILAAASVLVFVNVSN